VPRRLAIAALTFAGFVLSTPVGAQTIDPQFRADIESLLQVTGAGSLGAQMAALVSNQVIDSMKQAQQGLPERVATIVKETLNAEFTKAFEPRGELMGKMVGIYASHFTPQEVKGLLAFYGTDVGRKAVSVLPMLAQDGAAAGQQWAQQNMGRVLGVLQQRLRDEGLVK
jgi:hypothetical protein